MGGRAEVGRCWGQTRSQSPPPRTGMSCLSAEQDGRTGTERPPRHPLDWVSLCVSAGQGPRAQCPQEMAAMFARMRAPRAERHKPELEPVPAALSKRPAAPPPHLQRACLGLPASHPESSRKQPSHVGGLLLPAGLVFREYDNRQPHKSPVRLASLSPFPGQRI